MASTRCDLQFKAFGAASTGQNLTMALSIQSQRLTSMRASSSAPVRAASVSRGAVRVRAASATGPMGFELMRDGIKKASKETILTPRFYTTGQGTHTLTLLSQKSRAKSRLYSILSAGCLISTDGCAPGSGGNCYV